MNEACRGDSRLAATTTSPSSAASLEELPQRIRDIATLRGLGYTFREISKQFGVTPQAISLMLSRHRRVLKTLRGSVELAGLSPRAVNALGRHGIRSRAAAFEADVLELLKGERNCGKKTLEEIRRWMDEAPCAGQEVPAAFAAR
jgi:DNA-directed RNA polymerase alpha subunit